MGGVVLLELVVGIQLDGHLPHVVVDAAATEAEGVVVTLHIVEADATEVACIDGGVAPEEHAASSLVPLANERRSGLYVGGDVPHVAFADVLKVAEPEEYAVGLNHVGGSDACEGHELSRGVVVVQPEPCRSLVVVALLNELLRCVVDAEEADGCLTDTQRVGGGERGALGILGHEADSPRLAVLHIGDDELFGRSGQLLSLGGGTVGVGDDDAGDIGGRLGPCHDGIVAVVLV